MSARVNQVAKASAARARAKQWSGPIHGVDAPRPMTSFQWHQHDNAKYKHIHTWNTKWLAQVEERLHWTNNVKVTYASDDDSDDDDDSADTSTDTPALNSCFSAHGADTHRLMNWATNFARDNYNMEECD